MKHEVSHIHDIPAMEGPITSCNRPITPETLINTRMLTGVLVKGTATGEKVSCPYCRLIIGVQYLRYLSETVDEETCIANEEAVDFLSDYTVDMLLQRSLSALYPHVFLKEKR